MTFLAPVKKKLAQLAEVTHVWLAEFPMGPTGPATEFRLFPWGKHTSEKGTFLFDKDSARTVMQAFARKGRDIAMDYEHGMVKPDRELPTDGPVPAAGWFQLEVRGDGTNPEEDGLWAVKMKWTPRAMQYLSAKEYRFYSPAFLHNPKTNHIEELVNCALTNTPAQHDQVPLIAASENHDDHEAPEEPKPMKTLLAALSVTAEATEAEALSALNRVQARAADALELVKLSGKETVAEAKGVFEAWKIALETSKTQSAELVKLKADKRSRIVHALIKQGMDEKKITPATKEKFTEMANQKNGIKLVRAFLETATPVVGKSAGRPAKGGAKIDVDQVLATLSSDEKKIAAEGGISLQQFAETKAKHQEAALSA